MDNFNSNKLSGNEDLDKPIPFDDDTSQTKVSHSPLSLGGGGKAPAPVFRQEDAGVAKPVVVKPIEKKVSTPDSSTQLRPALSRAEGTGLIGGRITGVKTFFTKLHPGAMEFLDEQITKWLQENPGIHIKLTNTTTGEVQAKKTEPNIIITVWY